MTNIYRIAIDGPSGAGKSTIAKTVAKELNIDYIDTGAMYRAIGYKINSLGVPMEECESLRAMLDATDIDFVSGDVVLDGEIVNSLIRTPQASRLASQCSALPMVRQKLVEIQRAMGTRKSVIMDGRDIGTNVLKDAEYKIFLTASAEERADRRYKELVERQALASTAASAQAASTQTASTQAASTQTASTQTYEEVLEDIKQRDHNDMTRKLNPLKKAEDAIELDTTGMGIDDVVNAVLQIIKG